MKKQRRLKSGLAVLLAVVMSTELVPAMSGGAVEVHADASTPSVTAFATPNDLMNAFTPNPDNGISDTIGKLVFGKNENGNPQEWYILGADSGIKNSEGNIDNTIIFAAGPIATGRKFASGNTHYIKYYNPEWECTYPDDITEISSVNLNHYGGSELRQMLQGMVEKGNTTYFTETEKELMNSTTVTTTDTIKSDYTTTDKLYALAKDTSTSEERIIKAGTNNQTALHLYHYWRESSQTSQFWMRTGKSGRKDQVICAMWTNDGPKCSIYTTNNVNSDLDVRPASNLNLSSVLFASGATAASSEIVSGLITPGTAMTLRLDGNDTVKGNVIYNPANGVIVAQKDPSATGTLSLVVQGKGTIGETEKDWYYSIPAGGTTIVTAEQIRAKLALNENPSLTDCKIWLETTIDNVSYAKMAEQKDIGKQMIDSVAVTNAKPVGGTAFNGTASCTDKGISDTAPAITYTTTVDGGDVAVTGIAGWSTTYRASVTLSTNFVDNVAYVFGESVSAAMDGEALNNKIAPNEDGTLTVSREYTTDKRKIVRVTEPEVPANKTFTNYYGYEGYDEVLSDVGNSELGKQATVTLESTELVASTAEAMNVTWTIANDGGTEYDRTPGAANTFRWTIPASEFADYDATACQGYDTSAGTITGTVTITNKAATPVTITGTDSGISYTGETIDVTDYITIDSNPETAAYTLVTGTDGGTGAGSLQDTILTVTRTGTFKIKVEAAANGIYAAGENIITLTVDNGTIQYAATEYRGIYDGQPHSISVNVTSPEGTTVSYSTDGTAYGDENPSFINEGTYTVYYRITKDNYNTIDGSGTVTISTKALTITAKDQTVMWNVDIDRSINSVSENGLDEGDTLSEITLTPSTTDLTDNGTISISGVKIVNASGADVTGKYDIMPVNGTLKIIHNTTLAPISIEADKTRTSYPAGEILNVDDITVTAYYEDGYSSEVTGFTTNAADINMSEMGDKTLTVSYTENGVTITKDIPLTINKAENAPPEGTIDTSDNGTATYKVTTSDVTNGTVAYVAPTNKKAATVSVPAKVTIDGITYKVTSIENNAFANNKKITRVIIGSNITTIGRKAFYKCTKLKTVKIGKNVTTIGASAFYGCSKLTSVTMENKVTTISDKAFYKCTLLTRITIPSKVKKIGKQAFYGCKKLKSITIKTTKLTSKNVGSKAFKGIYASAKIKVPKSKLTSYKKLLKAKGVSSKAKVSGY